MQHVGDASFVTPSGAKQQLILSDQDGPRFTVHGNLIGPITIERAVTGTGMLNAHLKANDDSLRVPEMLFVEAWVERPGPTPARFCLGRFRIDYWDASSDGVMSEITIHARGPLGLLVDQPRQLVFAGELEQLVSGICATSAPTEVVGLGSHPIAVYINMESTYAALRLLAVSLGFVVNEDAANFRINVTELSHERERIEARPMLEINDGNTLARKYVKGSPIKKRT